MELILIPLIGIFSFFTPCMWNLNLLMRAYVKREGSSQLAFLLISRLALINIIALIVWAVSPFVSVSADTLVIVQSAVAIILILGFPLMSRLGIAPFDLSPQFLFPGRNIPPGISIGLSLPYCSIPFVVLLSFYSLHYGSPFLLFSSFALFTTLPSFAVPFLSEKLLKGITKFIPVVPALTGFLLLIAVGLLVDTGEFNLYLSSLLQERPSTAFLVALMFLLGVLTSLGPSTLPFLPVVFGFIVSRSKTGRDILLNTAGFSLAFISTHAFVGGVVSLGAVTLSRIFKTDIFNLILALLLFIIALNLLNLLPFSVEVSKLNPVSNPAINSFLLGVSYSFSLCPSCTSLLLGAIALSASTGDLLMSVFLMSVYALGRSVPIFLSGFIVKSIPEAVGQGYVNKFVGFLFLLLSAYFFKNFLEVL